MCAPIRGALGGRPMHLRMRLAIVGSVLAAITRIEWPALDPSPVIPSDLSFGYLSAELKSPVKTPIPDQLSQLMVV